MRFLSALIQTLLGCPHRVETFPRRGADGLDYIVCTDCGRRKLSPIQFPARRAAAQESEQVTGIDRMVPQ